MSPALAFRVAVFMSVALLLSSCSKEKSPTNPTPPASVATVAVGGTAPAVGAATQFTATATLTDGTTQSVTSQATWASSNNAVATVNSAGIVTGVAVGEADITATYQNVAGRSHIAVGRITFTLSGAVTDGTSGGVLPGVTVQVVDAGGTTQSARTDSTGAYSIGGVASGTATVTASAVSYQTTSQSVSVSGNARLDFVLQRVSCAFTLSTTGLSFGTSGGTGTVTITSNATGCAWTAKSNDAFITITSAGAGVDNGTLTFSVAANAGAARSGTLTIGGVTLTVTQDGVSIVTATYDSTFKTPVCNIAGSACDSGSLLHGSGSTELNQPNTLFNSCSDGSGSGHIAAVESIRVSTIDGSALAPGKTVRIDVVSLGGSTANNIRVSIAPNAQSPVWTQIASINNFAFGTFSTQTTLPAGSGLQAVRVNYAFGGGFGPGPCTTGTDDDTDDLVFRVQ